MKSSTTQLRNTRSSFEARPLGVGQTHELSAQQASCDASALSSFASAGNERPLVSICVACYNVEDYLGRAIASYSDERLQGRIEVILVDDGSSDGTASLISAATETDPEIFVAHTKENGGHGSAINAALSLAHGLYFRVIDADDWVDTEELIRFCTKIEDLQKQDTLPDILIDVKTEVNKQDMSLVTFYLPDELICDKFYAFDELCTTRRYLPYMMLHTMSVRTELLQASDLKLLEHTFYVDLEYVLKATLLAQNLMFLDTKVYQYLVGNESQSVADQGYVTHFDDHTRVCERLLALLDEPQSALDDSRCAYLELRCQLLCETHYNIALIFDKDRGRGLARAKEFRAWLKTSYPKIARVTEHRYKQDRILHMLGVNSQDGLDLLTHRIRHLAIK